MTGEEIYKQLTGESPGAAPPDLTGEDIYKQLISRDAGSTTRAESTTTRPQTRIGTGEPIPDAGVDIYGRSNDALEKAPGRVLESGIRAAVDGFGSGPVGLSPESEATLRRLGIYPPAEGTGWPLQYLNRAIINPLAAGGEAVVRGGNALLRGGQAAVAQAGVELGDPQLGREAAALPEVFPTGDTAGGLRFPAPENRLVATPQGPRFISEIYAPPPTPGGSTLDRINQLIAHDNAETATNRLVSPPAPEPPAPPAMVPNPDPRATGAPAFVPPGSTIPGQEAPAFVPPGATPPPSTAVPPGMVPNRLVTPNEPAPVGAQVTPTSAAGITPEAAAIAQSEAEHQRFNQTQTPGVPDTAIKVPGVEPTLAQMEQTVNTAREQKSLINLNRDVSQEERIVADDHNEKRRQYYQQRAQSQADLANATKARDDQMEADLGAAFANKTPADASNVADVGNRILRGPDGKRDLVVKEVNGVTSKLFDADGNIETDPEILYGVRKHINDRLSKEASVDDPLVVRAQSALLKLRDALDEAIEPAAPGFRQAINNYATASRPIDVMTALQKAEPKLFDTNGRMQYSRMHRLMNEIITARRPDAALSDWQSLTPDDMDHLWNLHDDLRRVASAEDLARAKGSDTAMNAADIGKQYLKMIGAGMQGIPFAGPAVRRVHEAMAPILSARASRQQLQRGLNMLYPDRSGIQPPLD